MAKAVSLIYKTYWRTFLKPPGQIHRLGVLNMASFSDCSKPSLLAQWTPTKARLEFRNEAFHGRSTCGVCMGSLQANMAMLPSSLADDFERFCELNKAPCPLLYRSQRGELSAGHLADNSDIRYSSMIIFYLLNIKLVSPSKT